ncbi:MAG TPA: M23 family metallopeptidase [Sphingomonas sp.]|nr:M23 family metallopeptidase [Sphingomonas sp.]
MVILPLLLLNAAAPTPMPPRLVLPVACTLGQTCAIQNYPDDDPGPQARNFTCHGQTYQGHDGTDFRLRSMEVQRQGVAVLAAASGIVLRARDGVEDRSIRDKAPVAGQECGNGLVVDHGGGWETQYCHMAKGSIAVRPGDKVAAGATLGKVGLSGNTEFPHLHLTVRKDGKAVDPFAWRAIAGSCHGGSSLWANTPAYREGQILVTGFAAGPVEMAAVQDRGSDQQPRPDRTTGLVVFVQAIGLQARDVQRLTLQGPGGVVIADNRTQPLDRDKAQYLLFVGRRTAPPGGWPAGEYRAAYSVLRSNRIVITDLARIRL